MLHANKLFFPPKKLHALQIQLIQTIVLCRTTTTLTSSFKGRASRKRPQGVGTSRGEDPRATDIPNVVGKFGRSSGEATLTKTGVNTQVY
jgi:hypothetical protein